MEEKGKVGKQIYGVEVSTRHLVLQFSNLKYGLREAVKVCVQATAPREEYLNSAIAEVEGDSEDVKRPPKKLNGISYKSLFILLLMIKQYWIFH